VRKNLRSKEVKQLIAKAMNDRKERISVALGESDGNYDRIMIKYPKTKCYLSLNPIQKILTKTGFYVAQVIDFYENEKRVILLCREQNEF